LSFPKVPNDFGFRDGTTAKELDVGSRGRGKKLCSHGFKAVVSEFAEMIIAIATHVTNPVPRSLLPDADERRETESERPKLIVSNISSSPAAPSPLQFTKAAGEGFSGNVGGNAPGNAGDMTLGNVEYLPPPDMIMKGHQRTQTSAAHFETLSKKRKRKKPSRHQPFLHIKP
jgi:hypothetical protein